MFELKWKLFGRPACLLLIGGLSLAAVGCDKEAQQRLASANELTDAIAKIQEANASAPGEGASVGQARLALLEEAAAGLQNVAQQGSPTQKAEAAKLLAGIHAQHATATAKQAELAYAQLRVRFANMLSALETADALASTALSAQQDPTQAVATMNEATQKYEARKAALDTTIGQLENEIATLNGQIAEQQDAARVAFGEKTKIESEAFVAEGDAKYETLDRAALAQRRADAADVAAQELQIRLNKLVSGLALAQRDAEMTAAALEQFADARQGFAEAGQDAQQTVRELRDQQHAAAEKLAADASALAEAFVGDVQQPLSSAAQRAESAVTQLEKALSGASGSARSSLETDLLKQRLVHAQTLATAATYAGSMHDAFNGIAGRAAFADAPELQQKLDALAKPLGETATTLKTAAANAVGVAKDSLAEADPEDGFATAALQTVTRLEGQVGAAGNAG